MKKLTSILIFLCVIPLIFAGCVGYGAAGPEYEEEPPAAYLMTDNEYVASEETGEVEANIGEAEPDTNEPDATEADANETDAVDEDADEDTSDEDAAAEDEADETNQEESPEEAAMEFTVQNENNPIATITMENGGQIIIELFPEIAPNTVKNFIYLAAGGFYDGLIFHRVIPNFMIQGGCPDGTGGGSPGHTIFGEFSANGFENNLSHTRGVISMARTPVFDSAGSQFFICVADASFLDREYAGFGMVVYGMDVADEIVNQPRGRTDRPDFDQRIATITIDTRGETFPPPEKLPGR